MYSKGESDMQLSKYNKVLKRYAIVRLYKEDYDYELVPRTTPATEVPRLLVIKVFYDTQTALVRYPQGVAHRVKLSQISTKSIINPSNSKYKRYLKEVQQAVNKEAELYPEFRDFLEAISAVPPEPTPTIVRAPEPNPEPVQEDSEDMLTVLKDIRSVLVELHSIWK